MDAFRSVFSMWNSDRRWNPDVICQGKKAEDRAQWLMSKKGLKNQPARWQVMAEFPPLFPKPRVSEWHGALLCEDKTADERVQWLMANQKMTESKAQRKVMDEFPHVFSAWSQQWNPGTLCGDDRTSHPADARARWVAENRGVKLETAREIIMMEFPWNFLKNSFLIVHQ